jgi:hypothetical protein
VHGERAAETGLLECGRDAGEQILPSPRQDAGRNLLGEDLEKELRHQ